MKRAVLFGLIAYVFLITGLIARNGTVLALSIPLVVYVISGIVFRTKDVRMDVKRTLSNERVSQGDVVHVSLAVTNEGRPAEEVVIEDSIPGNLRVVEGSSRAIGSMDAGDTRILTYTVRADRGDYRFGSVRIIVSDYLGVTQVVQEIAAPTELLALPTVKILKDIPMRPRRTLVYAGTNRARMGGCGVEFYDIREYRLGDALRHINWRVSARDPEGLYTNEYEQERVADVGMILDSRARSSLWLAGTSLFEYSVQAAASLSEAFLASYNRVGLLIYGSEMNWTFPGYGRHQREKILTALARCREGHHQVFEQLDSLPTRLFPSRSQIVFVSPLVPEDSVFLKRLRARGYRILVVSPNPISFERSDAAVSRADALAVRIAAVERRLLTRTLQRAGIFVLDWDVRSSFAAAVHASIGPMTSWLQHTGRL